MCHPGAQISNTWIFEKTHKKGVFYFKFFYYIFICLCLYTCVYRCPQKLKMDARAYTGSCELRGCCELRPSARAALITADPSLQLLCVCMCGVYVFTLLYACACGGQRSTLNVLFDGFHLIFSTRSFTKSGSQIHLSCLASGHHRSA